MRDDDERPRPKTHELGQDLSLLSAGECEERIAMLDAEIARLRQALQKKQASRSAADKYFK